MTTQINPRTLVLQTYFSELKKVKEAKEKIERSFKHFGVYTEDVKKAKKDLDGEIQRLKKKIEKIKQTGQPEPQKTRSEKLPQIIKDGNFIKCQCGVIYNVSDRICPECGRDQILGKK
jgi:predicted  nucleic acid-binding Zn-ribbon protein